MANTSKILKFPYQIIDSPEGVEALDDDALVFQARLHVTKFLVAVQSGMPIDNEDIRRIKSLNHFLVELGEPSVDISFLDTL